MRGVLFFAPGPSACSGDDHSANKGDATSGAQAGTVNNDSKGTLDPIQANPEPREADKQGGDEKPKGYEKVIANWTIVLGMSTVVLAIATILSAYFLFVTDHTLKDTLTETRKAADAATKAARATEDSVKIASDTARRQLRAYLAITGQEVACTNCPIKNKTIYPPKEGPNASDIRVTMHVKNFGVTPAYQVRTCNGTLLVEPDGFPPKDFSYSCGAFCETCPPLTMGPGAEERLVLFIPPREFVKATIGANRLFFFGTINFIDTFRGKRELQFCWMMQGNGKQFLSDAYGCAEHNAAVDD